MAASMVKVGVYIFARAIIDGGNIPHVIGGDLFFTARMAPRPILAIKKR